MKLTPEQQNGATESRWQEVKNIPLHPSLTPVEILEFGFKAGMRAGLNFKPEGETKNG